MFVGGCLIDRAESVVMKARVFSCFVVCACSAHIINPIPTNWVWAWVGVGPGLGFGLACLLPPFPPFPLLLVVLLYDEGMLMLGLLD